MARPLYCPACVKLDRRRASIRQIVSFAVRTSRIFSAIKRQHRIKTICEERRADIAPILAEHENGAALSLSLNGGRFREQEF